MEGLTWYVSDYQWNQRQTLQLAPIRNAHILVDKNEVGSVPHKINKNIMYARMGESFSFFGGVWRGEKCLFFLQATTTSSHLKKLETFHSALRRLKLESWKGRMEIFCVCKCHLSSIGWKKRIHCLRASRGLTDCKKGAEEVREVFQNVKVQFLASDNCFWKPVPGCRDDAGDGN